MLKDGILNPDILALLARFRHTNLLVIADRGFPHWPTVKTVDISLTDNIPTVLQVFAAIRSQCVIGRIFMAEEFARNNKPPVRSALAKEIGTIPVMSEAHIKFKLRVPGAIGLIRTGDTVQYANMILESA
jgi:D-ribose pyranase